MGETRETTTREMTTVTIDKPLGLTLEAGRGDVGAFVANVADGSNAARTDGVARGDVVRAVNGEDARAATFDDILDAIVRSESDPVTLTLSRWAAGPNATTPGDRSWLETKSARDDVKTLESGLMYRVLRTVCECHYVGTLADETTEFDWSRRRGKPLAFAPRQVILAWR